MKKKRVRVTEIEVERLILREPGGGRVRAVLETRPRGPGRAPGVRLVMYAPDGAPAIVLRVGGAGVPRVSVGDAAHGDAVVVYRQGVEVWRGGDVVAEVWPRDQNERGG